MRLLILLIPIFCGLIASLNLFEQKFFKFYTWSFAAAALFLAVLPITFNTDKKVVPVYHMFITLLLLIALFSAISFFDISKAKLPEIHTLIYSILAGVTLTAVVVALRPKS